ncbi:MAG: hypothetical protein JWP38_3588 [Herbaspirillum sp.]|jgi:hypothetical protein|nr:hypothetical protein [Herbaspirillum sp.]
MTSTTSSKPWQLAAAGPARKPIPFGFSIRFGSRQLSFCYDTYVRRYSVKPILECTAGAQPGHLQILMFRRWLLVLSKA